MGSKTYDVRETHRDLRVLREVEADRRDALLIVSTRARAHAELKAALGSACLTEGLAHIESGGNALKGCISGGVEGITHVARRVLV